MKVYIIISGRFYEDSTIIHKGFFDKQKTIDFMDNIIKELNNELYDTQVKFGNDPNNYRYYFSHDTDINWNSPLEYYEIQEIEIE
jgi:hypothetical protein